MHNQDATPLLRFESVGKSYGATPAVRALSFELPRGQVAALLGPNGAGKTTTMRLCLGLLRPDQGRVEVGGTEPARARARMGAMLQVSGVPTTLTPRELVDQFRAYYPRPLATEEVIVAAGLQAFADQRYGRLSGGQQRRVQFALALCGCPQLLLLDEPTTGLDAGSRRALWSCVRQLVEQGTSVLLATHQLDEADALADRVLVLHQGSLIADDTPSAVKSVVADRLIACTTRLNSEQLRALPGVTRVVSDGASTRLLTTGPEATLRALLEQDLEVAIHSLTGAGLEQAMEHLSGATREAA